MNLNKLNNWFSDEQQKALRLLYFSANKGALVKKWGPEQVQILNTHLQTPRSKLITRSRKEKAVRKMGLILRSVQRRPQMHFEMARKLRKHSKMRNFMFDAPRPELTKELRLGAN